MKLLKLITTFLLLTSINRVGLPQEQKMDEQKYNISITDLNEHNVKIFQNAGISLMHHDWNHEAQASVTRAEADFLRQQGITINILSVAPLAVDPEYHTYEELCSYLDSLADQYPDIAIFDTLGFSHVMHYPIPILKISDNPALEEDEPVIFYDGMHHAREPVGMECCLDIMDHLLSNYATDQQVKNWVDNTEIFIIPCLNPDGWKYVVDSSLVSPWWRKNMHDNNGNGIFERGYDGVDLNRNYDFWWEYGDPSPSSELYRGPAPFSESEITGRRDFVLSQKPVISISYHSYGEVVLYTKYLGFITIPEWPVIYSIASQIADLIPSLNGLNYNVGALDGTWSTSHNWCYQATGTMEFCIETADVFIPSGQEGQQVAADNLDAALYLLERVFKSGITGHATDLETGEPLPATIEIVGIDNDLIEPRTCDSLYGRYFRLLLPGTYTVRAFAENTDTVTVSNVVVIEDTLTVLDFELTHPVGVNDLAIGSQQPSVECYPNPTQGIVNFQLSNVDCQFVSLKLYDIHGREVAVVVDEKMTAGEHEVRYDSSGLPAGIYAYRLTILQASPSGQADDQRPTTASGKLVKY